MNFHHSDSTMAQTRCRFKDAKSLLKILMFLLLLTAISVNASGQEDEREFGVVDTADLYMSCAEIDSSAVAEILFDIGKSGIGSGRYPWEYTYERHAQVKIFKPAGLSYAGFDIPLYKMGVDDEDLITLEAVTYNLVDGKIVRSELDKDQVVTVKLDTYFSMVRFEMPDVRVGSIIEIHFLVSSSTFEMFRSWEFQYEIPARLSVYHSEIPEYFIYHIFQRGYHPVSISQKYETVSLGFMTSFSKDVRHMRAVNVPAINLESYTIDEGRYYTSVDFELSYIRYPNGIVNNFASSWKNVSESLMESFYFGQEIGKTAFMKEAINEIKLASDQPEKRMLLAYSHVKNRMKSNSNSLIYTSGTLREAYNKKKGNASDINLILLNMLRELGIEAYPVVLCTREYGFIPPTNPTLINLNYTLVQAVINDRKILLDACDPSLVPGIISEKCINGLGVLLKDDMEEPEFINLSPEFTSHYNSMYQLKMDSEGQLTGKMMVRADGYFCAELLRDIDNAVDEDAFMIKFSEKYPGMFVEEQQIRIDSSKTGTVSVEMTIDASNLVAKMGELFSFPVMLYDDLKENPFKLEERKYPVNFSYPKEYTTIINIELPQGLAIEELPESKVVHMEDNTGRFFFSVSQNGHTLQVMSKYSLNKEEFYMEEYQILKEYFGQIVSKHSEQVVLKKEQ